MTIVARSEVGLGSVGSGAAAGLGVGFLTSTGLETMTMAGIFTEVAGAETAACGCLTATTMAGTFIGSGLGEAGTG